MKLWEALEKSNKVRRKGWPDIEEHFRFEDDKAFKVNSTGEGEFTLMPIIYTRADDWEPYEGPKPATELQNSEDQLKFAQLSKIADKLTSIVEDQAKKIDRLEKAQTEHENTLKEWYRDIQGLRFHLAADECRRK